MRDINADIAKKAQELARLLDRRSQLGNKHSLRPSEDYHPLDWIGRAAASTSDRETGYRFESYVKPELERARCEFDLKYWPTLADVLMAAVHFAAEAQIDPTDPLTEAALSSRKDTAHVFVRAFLAGLRESDRLPADFKLSHSALATIANCALGLSDEDALDAHAVKIMLHRERQKNRR